MNQLYLKYYLQFVLVWLGIYTAVAQDSLRNTQLPDTSTNSYLITEVKITGNQKTKERVILRELLFKEGDKIEISELDKAIEESRINLLKQPLFNYVTIDKQISDLYLVKINIIVEERWFIWPEIAIINNDRNFNTWWQTKDFGKLDYRLYIKQYNALGLNHILRVGISYGFTRELSIYYKNIYLDKKQHHAIGFSAYHFQQQSIFYQSIENIREYVTLTTDDAVKGNNLKAEYNFRPRFKSKHGLFFEFHNISISDSIFILNPNYLSGNQKVNSFFSLAYRYRYDNRDSRGYPLQGRLFQIHLEKKGLGLLDTQSVNLFTAHASFSQFYLITNRFFGANSIIIKKSLENRQPYFLKEGLGYRDFLRGFEYYVIEGEDYYLSKNTFKFELLPQRISNLKFIPLRKFKKIHYAIYLTTHFDLGIAHEKDEEVLLNNNLSNKLLYSTGVGLDIATYYDRVFRFEYSFNSLNESGFFIHFKASI